LKIENFLFILLLTAAVSIRIFIYLNTSHGQTLPKDQHIKFEATIKNETKISGSSQVIEVADGKIYVDLYPKYKVGDRLLVEGNVDGAGSIFRPNVEKIGEKVSLSSLTSRLRQKISGNIQSFLPAREATLVSGAVLGVDSIDKNFRDELIKTGTIHVVVVSGQNLMIVAAIFLSMIKFLGRRLGLALALLAVFAYAFLTGFQPPVVRASLMVAASALAIFLGRQNWPLYSLALSAFLIVMIWPSALFEVSFQLTFAATLGIMTLGKWLADLAGQVAADRDLASHLSRGPVSSFPPASAHSSKKSNRNQKNQVELRAVGRLSTAATPQASILGNLANLFVNNAAIATSAYLFTAPVILYYFGKVSLIAPIANIFVAEAVFPMMVLGFLVAIVSLIFAPFAQILAYFAYVPAFFFSQVVSLFAKLPIGQIEAGKGSLILVVGFYAVILVLMGIWRERK